MLLTKLPLFDESGLTVFQNNLLSLVKESSFVKEFFTFFFIKPATITFLFFMRSQRLVHSFFEINIFHVELSHYGFAHRLRPI